MFFAVCGIDYADSSAILKAVTKKGINLNEKENFYYYPWIVRLMKTTKMSAETISANTICAGTLMNKQYILTAASCIFEWQKYFFQNLQNLYINPSFWFKAMKKEL
jgi:secreted trypsin-like serine protease